MYMKQTERKRSYERPQTRDIELQQTRMLADSLTRGAKMEVTYQEEDF